MAGAKFWYKPNPSDGRYKVVSLGRPLTLRRGPYPNVDQEYVQSITGVGTTTQLSVLQRIEVEFVFDTDLNDPSDSMSLLRQELVGLVNHLQRGGVVAFAENDAWAWAAFAATPPSFNDSSVSVLTTNLFPGSYLTLDEQLIYIQSDTSAGLCEMQAVLHDNTATGFIDLYEETTYDYALTDWVLVRQEGSYPAMRLVPTERNGEKLMTEDNRVFTLRLTLEEDPGTLNSMAMLNDGIPGDTYPGPEGGGTGGGSDPVPDVEIGGRSPGPWW